MSPSEAYPCPMCGAWHGTDSFSVSNKLNEAVKENAQLREELAATDAEVKKIVDSREAALDEVERLREAIKGLYRSRKILDGEGTWILISFDTGDWDRFVEIAREGR